MNSTLNGIEMNEIPLPEVAQDGGAHQKTGQGEKAAAIAMLYSNQMATKPATPQLPQSRIRILMVAVTLHPRPACGAGHVHSSPTILSTRPTGEWRSLQRGAGGKSTAAYHELRRTRLAGELQLKSGALGTEDETLVIA